VTLSRLATIGLCLLAGAATAQDYEREARWAADTLATLIEGQAVRIEQNNGHRFLALYTRAKAPRGAAIIAHGRAARRRDRHRGPSRGRLADAGWSTLSIQLPVLQGTGKLGDYLDTFPDARERFALAVDWLRERGYANVAIVSHSLGATMANHYLIRTSDGKVGAWVFISILNGLEDMFRIQIPVLDIYAERDWDVIITGADERRRQIARVPGSEQLMIPGAPHFFDGKREELTRVIVRFLDRAFAPR
jgi:pimeloyl-ACP methyl ester carboxylesterase